MKNYLLALLIPIFLLAPEKIDAKEITTEEISNNNAGYYSLGISYLNPVSLSPTFETVGGYMLFGYDFDMAWLADNDLSFAVESRLAFGLKGETHIQDYNNNSMYVARDGKIIYAISGVGKLNYALTDTISVYILSGVDFMAWRYQLKDVNSPLDNQTFSDSDINLAWGSGINYQLTDVSLAAEINSLGFNLGITRRF